MFVACGLFLAVSLAHAFEISPLSFENGDYGGGAECYIENIKGKVLVSPTAIKVDGKLIALNPPNITKYNKKWLGEQVSVEFSQKGKSLLEDKSGGFSVGVGKIGMLKISYQGQNLTLKAREACYGAD